MLWVAQAGAYPQYTAEDAAGRPIPGTNCSGCHGDYRSKDYERLGVDQGWGTDLMTGHRDVITSCDVCHGASRFPVSLFSSAGVGGQFTDSCLGCHGRFERPLASTESSGLRQHHWNAGFTSCIGCHLPVEQTDWVFIQGYPTLVKE